MPKYNMVVVTDEDTLNIDLSTPEPGDVDYLGNKQRMITLTTDLPLFSEITGEPISERFKEAYKSIHSEFGYEKIALVGVWEVEE